MRINKASIIYAVLFFIPVISSAQALEFDHYEYDFGTIKSGDSTAVHVFDFCNATTDTLQISRIEARERTTLQTPVGYSEKAYPYSWEEIRTSEQEIGRIVTAAYLDKTGADVSFENAGGIRSGIPAGNITYQDVISISPYGNTLLTKQMTGQEILDLVEYSLQLSQTCNEIYSLQKQAVENGEDPYAYSWPDNSGSVLQFGGITVQYDATQPAEIRIVSAEIGGNPVDLEKMYIVATNHYAAENSDYPALAKAPLIKEFGTCEEALKSYIAKGDFSSAAEAVRLSARKAPDSYDSDTTNDVSDSSTPVSGDDSNSPNTGDKTLMMAGLTAAGALSVIMLLAASKPKKRSKTQSVF